ncbi:uncharacterized protein VTP21DRAFT_5285 [Calcarisporiella thermophila]|uniref:uncharacterized protein n=1 Tax=Calcarisporiella thermophila TaxID=911321 RepID=UPI003743658D
MKFGKQLINLQVPEWAPYYLNYKALKKIIGSLQNAPVDTAPDAATISVAAAGVPDADPAKTLQSIKAAFFFRLERELEKINQFYLQKEAELNVRLRTLVDKKKIVLARDEQLMTHHKLTSLTSLQEAFHQFEHDLNKLQKFVEINGTGFRKILKKWDKRSKSSTKELYLSRQVEIQPCFNQQSLAEFADVAASNLLELDSLADGQAVVPSATATTEVMPQQRKSIDFTASIGKSAALASASVIDELSIELHKAMLTGSVALVQEVIDRIRQHPFSADSDRVSRVFWRACSDATDDIVQLVVGSGLINFKYIDDINDRTCLHEAAITGSLALIKQCVEHRADVNAVDAYGRRPIHYMAMHGHGACARFVLDHGANYDVSDHDGFTPFIYAVINGHTECVKIFLEAGAEVEPANAEQDYIPLSLACQYGHKDVALLLMNRGAKVLLNSEGMYPLHLTCRAGHPELTRMLTQYDSAHLDTPDTYKGWTPLFYAASDGHIQCVRALIEAGCKLNMKDEFGLTPVYYAAWEGHVECVAVLLEAGCVVDSVVDEPMTSAEGENAPNVEDGGGDPDDLDIPDLSLPPPIIPFRIYGHNYLDKKYLLQIRLGHKSRHHRKQPVRLYGDSGLSSLKLVISSKPDTGLIPYNVILPLADEGRIFSFQVASLENLSLEFDIYPTFGSRVIGRGVTLQHLFDQNVRTYGPLPYGGCGGASSAVSCPLFDPHLKVVGEVSYEFSVIRPFRDVQLEIGGRIETYWKATGVGSSPGNPGVPDVTYSPVHQPTTGSHGLSGAAGQSSFVTASSLSGEYIQVFVQVTRDMVPVVFSGWMLPMEGLDLCVSDVTYEQFKTVGSRRERDTNWERAGSAHEVQRIINQAYLSLEQVLTSLPPAYGLNIEVLYPMAADFALHRFANIAENNEYVDAILKTVYQYAQRLASQSRSIIFSSFNPSICMVLNWKQPNYAVFFSSYCGFGKDTAQLQSRKRKAEDTSNVSAGHATISQLAIAVQPLPSSPNDQDTHLLDDPHCSSFKEAVKFAKTNNLLGIMCYSTPLVQVPPLISTIKEAGLVLVTFGEANNEPRNVRLQEQYQVDACVVDGVIRFSNPNTVDL